MKARVTKEFQGVRDGNVYPSTIAVGECIFGELAAAAVTGGMAEEIAEELPAAPKKAKSGKGKK
jgi:hypothetical protein